MAALCIHWAMPRQMLAELDAGDVGGNRLELAADPIRRVRLEIEHVLGRRPAEQIEENDALRLAGPLHNARLSSSASKLGRLKNPPRRESAPACSVSRRVKPSQQRRGLPSIVSIRLSPKTE